MSSDQSSEHQQQHSPGAVGGNLSTPDMCHSHRADLCPGWRDSAGLHLKSGVSAPSRAAPCAAQANKVMMLGADDVDSSGCSTLSGLGGRDIDIGTGPRYHGRTPFLSPPVSNVAVNIGVHMYF